MSEQGKRVYLQLIAFRTEFYSLIIFSWIFHGVYNSFHSLLWLFSETTQNGEQFSQKQLGRFILTSCERKGIKLKWNEIFNEGRMEKTLHSTTKDQKPRVECHANYEGEWQWDKDLNRIIAWQSSWAFSAFLFSPQMTMKTLR